MASPRDTATIGIMSTLILIVVMVIVIAFFVGGESACHSIIHQATFANHADIAEFVKMAEACR